MAKKYKKSGGREVGQKNRDPRALMHEMGFGQRDDLFQSPIEFLLCVMNADIITLNQVIAMDPDAEKPVYFPTMGQRIEAARHAAPYLHQKLPAVVEQNVTHSWADQMREAEERLQNMRKNSGTDEQWSASTEVH